MYILISLLSLLGFAAAVSVTEVQRNDDLREATYVLPTTTYPTFYDVQLFIDPSNVNYFFGNVSIRIIPNVGTNVIVIHAMAMEIDSIEVYSDRDVNLAVDLFSTYTLADDDTHMLRISLSRVIGALEPHVVKINYKAEYAENMFGVYVSTYEEDGETVNLVTSQLQPTFARRAFPCYDEPHLKAIFRTTIYAPAAYDVVRSNMPERNETLKEDVSGWVKHEFEDTLVMSSYLLAYLVSNFHYISNDDNPIYRIPFRVYSRPETLESADFALDFGQKNMIALENYTEFEFAFPKIDKAAVPDFAAGAMENWGLVIYREVALLVTDNVTTTATKQNIGRIICHENTHMWFGNEVGPLSWTYTWLNEGFANYFENFGTDLVLPDWRMMDQFVIAMQNVFQSDAVLSVNPMTHPVYSPSEILGTFNAVAYQKSGSVIRMMAHFLTPEIFRQGLVIYIRNKSREAAHPSDLYAALQEALDQSNHTIRWPVATIMERWTTQGGFPVLGVTRSSPSANSLVISQERYLTDRSQTSNDRWHIPVNWVLSSDPDFSDTAPQHWIPVTLPAESVNIPGLGEAEWYIINKQQTGYYRVNYDEANWRTLADVLNSNHEAIHLLNRAQIVDDAFNLARTGRLQYNLAFDISRYLIDEEDYIPWAAANAAFSYLDVALSGAPAVHRLFQNYVLNLTAPMYESLGFIAGDEKHVTPYFRNIILNFNCRLGNERCTNRASEILQAYRDNPVANPINPDIQTTIYCSTLRGGSRENFDYLWGLYQATSDSSQQSILLNALGCTNNVEARDFYLNQVIADNSPVREQDRHTIIVAVTNASPENTDAALDFIIENFHLIQPRVQGLTGTTNILNAFSRTLTTPAHETKMQTFIERHNANFTAGELASIAAIEENLSAAINWMSLNFEDVDNWLDQNYGTGSGAMTLNSSLFICISMILALFYHDYKK
ncbi:aminopeptidase N-like [Plodia interpunctella]|uniref:aminopeptidase N-like n=1 Tax=Plodia interpunctella TaxID=58824 RepID=UPI002367D85D|nr:aminopeptidase N-like [Plodia interpunctella]